MKKLTIIFAAFLLLASFKPEGLKVGDKAADFKLKNIDGKMVGLSDYKDSKGVILVFTCNHCPFAKKYEDRVIALDKKYKSLGFPVVAVNPNDVSEVPEDSYDNMQKRAKEKGFGFPYLVDETQATARTYGATRTPHVYVLQNVKGTYTVKYIGAIDDNSDDAKAVKEKYVESAVDALLAGKEVSTNSTKAIGCTIKWKKA
ncbi:MAG: thiol-disulfide isomerase or thioredoxin [Bacteroidota bacterium]|nr:thiol-disulfide isomerase or thioredoxin [Bacteroidota bacterium]